MRSRRHSDTKKLDDEAQAQRRHPRDPCDGPLLCRRLGPAPTRRIPPLLSERLPLRISLDLLIMLGERSLRGEAEAVFSQESLAPGRIAYRPGGKLARLGLQDQWTFALFFAQVSRGLGVPCGHMRLLFYGRPE